MGPRLKDVEDVFIPSAIAAEWFSFNGATSQGRGRRLVVGRRDEDVVCFNGATSQGRGRLGRFAG